MTGDLFSISYLLRVFIKHDSYNAFGEGNCISLPIKIMQPPQNTLTMDVLKEIPEGWNPYVAQPVQLALPAMLPTDPNMPGSIYYREIIATEAENWTKRDTMKPKLHKGEPENEKFEEEKFTA